MGQIPRSIERISSYINHCYKIVYQISANECPVRGRAAAGTGVPGGYPGNKLPG